MSFGRLIKIVVGGALAIAGVTLVVVWTTFRVYVPHDKCLVLIRKTGDPLPSGATVAGPGQKGIQRETLGPGRYFFNPWVFDWELKDLVKIDAGDPQTWETYYASGAADIARPELKGKWPQIGILVDKVGKPSASSGDEVVDEGFQGIQKHVLTPGTYRINPYVYDVKPALATVVPLGCCGVVTSQMGEMPGSETIEETSIGPDGQPIKGHPKVIQKLAAAGQRGVLANVLAPGIYYLNPYVHKVQIVQIGYNQVSELKSKDVSTHIAFPSKDGFTIDVEVTVVWGRHPSHIAEMINRFGDVEKIKQIILGQMRSICRNLGSDYESTDFIRGEKRELYQKAVTETLQRVCRERDIEILIALIHNIEVHANAAIADSRGGDRADVDLKTTIQRGFIAREQDLTKQAQRDTAKFRAELETSKMEVEVAREKISAGSRKSVAELKAEGQKKAQEIEAQRDLEVARIDREIAELDAETTRALGKAKAQVEQLKNQAEADGKRMMIEAFGTGRAYNLYTFAQGFAPDSIRLIFAGEGTFWTDLSKLQDVAAMELLKKSTEK